MDTQSNVDKARELYNDLAALTNVELGRIYNNDKVVFNPVTNKTRQKVILELVAQEFDDNTLYKVLNSGNVDVKNLNFKR